MKQILQLFSLLFLTSLYSQQQGFEVFNTSINSGDAELGITFLNENTVIFASSKKNKEDKYFKKNRRKNNRQLHLELYQANILESGELAQTNKFSNEINNKFFESDISFSTDRKIVYFTWNNFYNTKSRKDSAKWKTLQIMKASINENFEISDINRLPFNNEKYSVRSPHVSKNGKQLFFVSDMPNGYGKMDIYVVDILANGMYSEPRNLGSNVNTKESELYPFKDDNILYFSSYGHKGKGGLDIFKSNFENGTYQKAKNLATPINSRFDDFALVIDSSINSGYFTSNRENGKGDVDIYNFKPKQKIIDCSKVISGIITDNVTQKSIDNVLISLFHNNIMQETKVISKDSKYSFKLKCNENYKIIVTKENYHNSEFEIIPNANLDNNIIKNLLLTPINCSQIITGNVFNRETNNSLSGSTISLYQNNVLKETLKVNEESKFNFQVDCNKTYKLVAEKEYFINAEIVFQTNGSYNFETTKDLLLTPINCSQLITGVVLNKETSNSLPGSTISLYQNNILKETFKINEESKFNFQVACNETYKLIAEKENFINAETVFQTNGSYNLETTKNLLLTPINCRQLITGVVLDKQTNKPLFKSVVTIFKNNILIDTLTLNNKAAFNYKLECNSKYKINTFLKNYQINNLNISTSKTRNKNLTNNILLEPTIEFVTVRDQKMIKINPISFDLDEDKIRLDAAIELEKVITILNKYPTIKLEIKSHTDSRAPDNYNMTLSNKRATATINYIISKGINPYRITGRGYGETELVNKCTNGVKCSQIEHEQNRRTEFIIIDE